MHFPVKGNDFVHSLREKRRPLKIPLGLFVTLYLKPLGLLFENESSPTKIIQNQKRTDKNKLWSVLSPYCEVKY